MTALPLEDEVFVSDVRQEWDNVLPGLLEIKNRFEPYWRPEDIYALCRNGDAYLYMFEGGFVIAGRTVNRYNLEVELHIYAMHSKLKDGCTRYLPFFEGLARQIGAKAMTMESARNGFLKRGWEKDYIRYKRSLS